jgi:16S rRNA C1402 N4-methylase RsmH
MFSSDAFGEENSLQSMPHTGSSQLMCVQELERIVGFDQDAEALELASQTLHELPARVDLVHSNFRYMSLPP